MSQVNHSVLVVDDEPGQRQLLRAVLEKSYAVVPAASADEAQQLLRKRSFDLIITDQQMPGKSGIDLIVWVRDNAPEIPVIVLTAYGTIHSAVEAIKQGAQDYLSKPLKDPEELRLTVKRVLEQKSLRDQGLIHREERDIRFPPDIVAESSGMKEVLRLAHQVAPQPTTVLISGESGTGKEVIARLLHRDSPRADGPFVAVNCAALTEHLLESELFGHEKGAFTGATQSKRGRFELAHGGTLFLDEIGEMSSKLQSKLLRALQDQRFERVGGTRTISVDVRVIAATNRDLPRAIRDGAFREDLYYRLNVFPIEIPPLRERRADIIPLAHHFIRRISARMGVGPKELDRDVVRTLHNYDWPGNIRELQNAVERALIVSQSSELKAEDLPLTKSSSDKGPAESKCLSEIERKAILEALSRNSGDRRSTAEELGISLRTLQYRLKEYGITGRKG